MLWYILLHSSLFCTETKKFTVYTEWTKFPYAIMIFLMYEVKQQNPNTVFILKMGMHITYIAELNITLSFINC